MISAERYTKKRIFWSMAAAVLLFYLMVGRCRVVEGPPEVMLTGLTMGTTYTIKIAGPGVEERASATAQAVDALLQQVNNIFSTYIEDSELSRFNKSDGSVPFPLSNGLRRVIEISLEVSRQTGGAFDITVGPLVNAWGFGPDTPAKLPTDAEIAALRERIGYEKLTLENGTLRKARPDVYCDLSAVAKGYGVDCVARKLDELGIANYMVEIGGEVRTRGTHQAGTPWKIAIEKPVTGQRVVEHIVPLSNLSMATSGDYRNFFDMDGRRYSHTINPSTGRPIEHRLASVSVLHPECAWADAYATALNVLGPEEGYALAERLGLQALFIVRNDDGAFTERATRGFPEMPPQMGSTT